MESIESRLSGGHHNSLGNTEEVVADVLKHPELFEELFNCYQSKDEVVRLRVSSAMKRICKADKTMILPYLDRFQNEIAKIDQASTQWTLAQLFDWLKKDLSERQLGKAKEIMMNNVANHDDWIVLNLSMDTLSKWAKKDEGLKSELIPHLERIKNDPRKSVSKKALRSLGLLK